MKMQSIYQNAVPLRPGLYRLDLVIKDVQSGNIGVVNARLAVPRYEDDKLAASSLILADQIEHVPAKEIGTGQFVLGSSKVRPRLEGDFTSDQRLGIYMQVYNLKPDDSTHKSNANFAFTVKRGNEPEPGMQFKESSADMRSEEHTSELQSRGHLVCRLLLEKKKKKTTRNKPTQTTCAHTR